jgi:hypothetical protein
MLLAFLLDLTTGIIILICLPFMLIAAPVVSLWNKFEEFKLEQESKNEKKS